MKQLELIYSQLMQIVNFLPPKILIFLALIVFLSLFVLILQLSDYVHGDEKEKYMTSKAGLKRKTKK